jgi:mRNA interferase RelE/StbE
MLKLQFTRDAQKILDTLTPKQFRQIVQKVFALLADPRPHDSKELKGYPFLRNDIGEYRIIYDVQNDDTLRLICVGKRNDDAVNKKLERQER